MIAFFGVFLVAIVAVCATACAINYFFRLGPWPSLGIAMIAVSAFLLFCVSGLWADAHRHDWGALTPVFALMLLGGFLCIKFGKKIWAWWQRKINDMLG